MRIGDHVLRLNILGQPNLRASGGVGQFPFVFEQHVEIAVVPGGRVRLPRAFNAGSGGVDALAGAELVDPAKAHGFQGRGFRLRADEGGIACAVGLAEGVATGHEGDGFFVIHRHAAKGFAHIAARGNRIGHAIGAFGVHVDQAHLHGSERVIQLTLALVAAVFLARHLQPFGLGAPVDVFFGRPEVFAACAEAKGLEAHGFQGDVARQNVKVGPRNAVAVFLLDRPEEATRFIQVAIVRPRVQRCKALGPGRGATAAIGGAVGAGRVPGQTNHQAAVMAPVGRPPVLAVGHQLGHIRLQRGIVGLGEGFSVVEIRAQRVRGRAVLMQDGQIQLVRPPFFVGARAMGRGLGAVHHRAFACVVSVHLGLLIKSGAAGRTLGESRSLEWF